MTALEGGLDVVHTKSPEWRLHELWALYSCEQAVKRQVGEQSCHVVGRRTGACRPPVVQTCEWETGVAADPCPLGTALHSLPFRVGRT